MKIYRPLEPDELLPAIIPQEDFKRVIDATGFSAPIICNCGTDRYCEVFLGIIEGQTREKTFDVAALCPSCKMARIFGTVEVST